MVLLVGTPGLAAEKVAQASRDEILDVKCRVKKYYARPLEILYFLVDAFYAPQSQAMLPVCMCCLSKVD